MKTFWIIVAITGSVYLTVLAVFVAGLVRSIYRAWQIRDVIDPEDLNAANDPIRFCPCPSTSSVSVHDPEPLGEINYECIP